MIGKTVGHYEIIEKIGEGGMGVVYRAEDTRLKRTIALKFLPQDLTRSAEARERFIHEAQAASALDHPNICTIYEIDETDEGQVYIVMGLYEGQTLREKISERPLKLEDAIDITSQIAQGLAKAHEQKIIHRDIKPANIFITNEGQVKVLDFGVAKLAGSTKLTLTGTTLGTVSYMAPEQAKGDEADHKADIWSLGVLMYEMLTGQQPFKGEHEQAIIYSILNEEPEPITSLRTGIPIDLEWIVQKALRKDPKQRYQHIDELPVDLSSIDLTRTTAQKAAYSAVVPTSLSETHSKTFSRAGWFIAATIALLVGGYLMLSSPPPPPVVQHLSIELPPECPLFMSKIWDSWLAVSPDGSQIVYTTVSDNLHQLCIKETYGEAYHILPGTVGGGMPFFSPDGEWLGFLDSTDGWIKKILLPDGTPIPLFQPMGWVRQPIWTDDNQIIYGRINTGLYIVSLDDGTPEILTELDLSLGEKTHRYPQLLPGGDELLFMIGTDAIESYDDATIAVVSLKTGRIDRILTGGANPRYVPSGHIIYGRNGRLMAVGYDYKDMEITGSPTQVLEGIVTSDAYGIVQCAISEQGTLIYAPGGPEHENTRLVWTDRNGIIESTVDSSRVITGVALAPDRQRIALEVGGANNHIWVYASNRMIQLTTTGNNLQPTWTLDGERLLFHPSDAGGGISSRSLDLSQQPQKLTGPEGLTFPSSFSPDGESLLFVTIQPGTRSDIHVLEIDTGVITEFCSTPATDVFPGFSPDGDWVAYSSNESGRYEVYVRSFPDASNMIKVSIDGGTEPLWSPDGKRLFYVNSSEFMVVDVETRPTFTCGIPSKMFEHQDFQSTDRVRSYQYDPDGDRFLLVLSQFQRTMDRLNIVNNWFEELHQLPGGR